MEHKAMSMYISCNMSTCHIISVRNKIVIVLDELKSIWG